MRMCVFVLAGAACLSVAGGQVQPSGAESPKPAGAQGADSASGPQVTEGVVNAPIAEVWRVFSTSEGFKKLGVAKCEMDLRIGGLIRTHYNPEGVIGDAGTIENEILALEPGRMLAFRIHKPPATFPFSQ